MSRFTRTLFLLTSPWLIIPWGLIVSLSTGGRYQPWQIATAAIPLILQGSDDWGGSCLFAGWIANYLFFTFAAPIQVILYTRNFPPTGYFAILRRVIWRLKWHIILFAVLGPAWIGYDSRVTPNDHRNMFIFFAIYYCLLLFYVSALLYYNPRLPLLWGVIPSLLLVFFMMDGITSKAGQWNRAGYDTPPVVRGVRHGLFLKWHFICDHLLGDV